MIEFSHDLVKRESFTQKMFEKLRDVKDSKNIVSLEDFEVSLKSICNEFELKINFKKIKEKLFKQTRKFLQSSSAICFSETKDNFLMWSHYANKHSGICLEFNFDNQELPYKYAKKSLIHEKPKQDFSIWRDEGLILTEKLRKVKYQKTQPYINFFRFAFIFINENKYNEDDVSYEFCELFSQKTIPWKYEKEWRSVQINFRIDEQPENRIRNYPIECLSAVYFGIKTPEIIKHRIYNIFELLKVEMKFFDCVPTDTRKLKFKEWIFLAT